MRKLLLVMCLPFIIFTVYSNQNEIAVIKSYYRFLEEKKLEEAYAISTKKVSFSKFKSWYGNVFKAEPDNFKRNADGSYSFTVWYSEYYDYMHDDNKVYYFQVTMTVKDGRIADSKSKQVGSITEKTLAYKNSTIELVDDFKANAKRIYIVDGNKKRVMLDSISYDHTGLTFGVAEIQGNLLIVQAAGFEGVYSKVYNLPTKTPFEAAFGDIYISPGGSYVLSYMAEGMLDGGVQLEVAKGKRINKKVFGSPGAYAVKVETKQGRDYLHIDTDGGEFTEVIDLTAFLSTL